MEALATPCSPLSFEAAQAFGQTGRFITSSSINTYRVKPSSSVFSRHRDDEDWC